MSERKDEPVSYELLRSVGIPEDQLPMADLDFQDALLDSVPPEVWSRLVDVENQFDQRNPD